MPEVNALLLIQGAERRVSKPLAVDPVSVRLGAVERADPWRRFGLCRARFGRDGQDQDAAGRGTIRHRPCHRQDGADAQRLREKPHYCHICTPVSAILRASL